jgi:hypothetical protein
MAKSDTPTTSTKRTEVKGDVVLKTEAFDVEQPVLVDAAETAFREQVKDIHGDGNLTDVTLTGYTHEIGDSVRYSFTGVLEG